MFVRFACLLLWLLSCVSLYHPCPGVLCNLLAFTRPCHACFCRFNGILNMCVLLLFFLAMCSPPHQSSSLPHLVHFLRFFVPLLACVIHTYTLTHTHTRGSSWYLYVFLLFGLCVLGLCDSLPWKARLQYVEMLLTGRLKAQRMFFQEIYDFELTMPAPWLRRALS